MALNLILLPEYLDKNKIERIQDRYKGRKCKDNIDYHVLTYSEGTLMRSIIDVKESYDINELTFIAYRKEIEKAGRAVKWLKCGLDSNSVRIIELEGDSEKDNSKLE